jgi:putative ABC transport system substrate-binding protein
MRRREFIMLLGGAAAAWPLAARAQQPDRVRRVGVLMAVAESDSAGQAWLAAFQDSLQKLGWANNRNVILESLWSAGDQGRMETNASILVSSSPDVIVANASPALEALRRKTKSIPIVFVQVTDPVGAGFVPTLAHPGGNITGFTNFEPAFAGKWIELLKEIAPDVRHIGFLAEPEVTPAPTYWRAFQAAAPSFGVEMSIVPVHERADIEGAVTSVAHHGAAGLFVMPNPIINVHREMIIALATRNRLPAIYTYRYFVADGGLISYGIDVSEMYRQAATYVDRILKGEKPADLPVQAPTKFELAINLKTAKALGLTVPPTLLTRADEVIE